MTNKRNIIVAAVAGGLLFSANLYVVAQRASVTPAAPVVVAPTYAPLAAGTATFTPADGETTNLTYTASTRLGGYGLDRSWGSTPSFIINWGDGMTTGYRFYGDNVQVQELTSEGRGASYTGTWESQGGDILVTSESGAVTVLGQLDRKLGAERVRIFDLGVRLEAERAAERQLARRLNNETFDEMITRLTKQVCVRAEGLDYISTRNVMNAASTILPTFPIGDANQIRWNNMSPQLRQKRVTSKMNWECNDVAQVMHQNTLTDTINGAIILNSIFN